MGSKDKRKAKFVQEEEEEAAGSVIIVPSSDDEEANEDLSIKIVEKSLLMRAASFKPENGSVLVDSNDECGGSIRRGGSLFELFSDEADTCVSPSGDGAVLDEKVVVSTAAKKTKKKKSKKPEAQEQQNVVISAKEEEQVETVEAEAEKIESTNPDSVEIKDNIVLRKLLRGPRYFDPPDSWGTCYNCGEEGHAAVNCTSAKRKKPCFVCGSLDHSHKNCQKGKVCFICNKGGHRAKGCPEKRKDGSQGSMLCLKCGDHGHDLLSCRNDYTPDDVKDIECYVCKGFGHLCCADFANTGARQVSCYRCGQLGHTGLACTKLQGDTIGAATPSSCYKCGEGGHFARECTSSARAFLNRYPSNLLQSSTKLYGDTSGAASPSSCYRCGEGGHFARECRSSARAFTKLRGDITEAASPSLCYRCGEEGHFQWECTSSARNAGFSTPLLKHRKSRDERLFKSTPDDFGKAYKRKTRQYEDGVMTTPHKSKRRGGWIVGDPADFPDTGKKLKKKSLKSPVGHGRNSSSFSSNKVRELHSGSSLKQGSGRASQNKYSPRFRRTNTGGTGKYNWW